MSSVELAYQKPANSSLILPSQPQWNAAKTVDGNTNTNVYCGSCLHTLQEEGINAYLRIDLEGMHTIHRVEIFSRQCYMPESNCVLGIRKPTCDGRGK